MKSFENQLRQTGLSQKTISVYLMRITQFHEYCTSSEIAHNGISRWQLAEIVHDYCDYLESERSLKRSSINCTLTSLEQFFTAAGIRLPRVNRKRADNSVKMLDPIEELNLVAEILRYPSAKFKAIAVLPLYAGLKTGELRSLKTTDLDLSERPAVQVGTRRVPLTPESKAALEEWLGQRRSQLGKVDSTVLFPNSAGEPMSGSSIDAAIRTVAREARLNISARMLRNIYIRTLLESKTELGVVAYLAGFQRYDSMVRFFELAGLQIPGVASGTEGTDFSVESPYAVAAHPWANQMESLINGVSHAEV